MKNQLILLTLVVIATTMTFGQPLKDTVVDSDGNVYHTVKIGKQIWMVEDLQVTHYRNGDTILTVPDSIQWGTRSERPGKYFNIDSSNRTLYNFNSVIDNRGLSPIGWHVPSDKDWKNLFKYVTENCPQHKIKIPNAFDQNVVYYYDLSKTGFAALSEHFKRYHQGIADTVKSGYWWTCTVCTSYSNTNAFYNKIDFTKYGCNNEVYCTEKKYGFRVRLIKEN